MLTMLTAPTCSPLRPGCFRHRTPGGRKLSGPRSPPPIPPATRLGERGHDHPRWSRHRRRRVRGQRQPKPCVASARGSGPDRLRRPVPHTTPATIEGVPGRSNRRGGLALRPEGWHIDNGIELLLGGSAAGLDTAARKVLLGSGRSLTYEQLLIATGSAPRQFAGAEQFDNVYALRTVADARALRGALAGSPRVVVVGAGFIGQEVAATADARGASVTIVEAASAPLAATLGERLGRWFAHFHREHGIEVLLSTRIVELHGSDAIHAVELQDGRQIDCDLLVVGIGTEPQTAWLRDIGLDHRGVRTTPPAGR